jgi:pimeloyl-ACP methyl ester carboxylesterase
MGGHSGAIVRSEHRVRVAGTVVPYVVAGEGEPVVMIHGLGGSSRCWTWTLPALAPHHRVFLVDLPGFGRLRRLHRQFALESASVWIQDWMRAAGVDHAHLVGHSMGALIAAQVAVATPAAVDRLVLISAVGVPTGQSVGDSIRRVPAGWRHRSLRAWRLVLWDAVATRPSLLWRTARALLAQDVRSTLSQIRARTLVMWGADDPMVPAVCAATFRRRISGARLLLFPSAGHLPMLTRPEEFNRALLAFLRGEPVGE